ncbi:MAG: sulfur carrier protein ThiS, partial [Chloroflexi bacterium]|nr:sulfur carrier protein ThiS [Chloroflexota bacterium]
MTTDERIPHVEESYPRAASIRIRVNGEDRHLASKTVLAAFLKAQDVPAQFVAVAVNNEVVRRADHPCVILEDGDVVE